MLQIESKISLSHFTTISSCASAQAFHLKIAYEYLFEVLGALLLRTVDLKEVAKLRSVGSWNSLMARHTPMLNTSAAEWGIKYIIESVGLCNSVLT